jgi:hypothetical protein
LNVLDVLHLAEQDDLHRGDEVLALGFISLAVLAGKRQEAT